MILKYADNVFIYYFLSEALFISTKCCQFLLKSVVAEEAALSLSERNERAVDIVMLMW